MSTTGLLLWFNDVTFGWLPSGITDVAVDPSQDAGHRWDDAAGYQADW
jgi:hypothetical protein